ncbi:hypothetical protein V8E53_004210 [Lactarius tabidus]
MAGNDDLESSTASEPTPPQGLSSSSWGGLAASVQEGQDDVSDRPTNIDVTPPPLGVKLTLQAGQRDDNIHNWHRKGRSSLPGPLNRTDDIGLGRPEALAEAPTASSLYWVGLYEQPDANKWKWVTWVLEVDLAPAFGYSAMRAFETFMYILLYPNGRSIRLFFITLSSLDGSFMFPHIISIRPHIPTVTKYGIAGFSFILATPSFPIIALVGNCL